MQYPTGPITCNMLTVAILIGKGQFCGQTHRHTHSQADDNTPLPYRGATIIVCNQISASCHLSFLFSLSTMFHNRNFGNNWHQLLSGIVYSEHNYRCRLLLHIVARSVFVCVCVYNGDESCKNGRTNQDVVWHVGSGGPI